MADKTLMLTSPDAHGRTRIGVNGVQREIPHNKKVTVTEEEYEVLQNADLGIAKITELKDNEDTDGEVKNIAAGGGAKEGTEASPIQAPATPAATSTDSNALLSGDDGSTKDARRGGDVELKGGDETGHAGQTGGAGVDGADKGNQGGEGGSGEGGSDDEKFLDRSIASMQDDIEKLDDSSRLDALIAQEKKRNDPRSTLIEKLEARKASLAE